MMLSNDSVAMDDAAAAAAAAAADTLRLKTQCIFWFEGVLVPAAGAAGLLGNVLCILVLKRRDLDLTGSFINLLITLCVFDSLFIVAVNLFYTLPIHSEFYDRQLIPYLTPALLPLIHIVLTGSVYSVVAVAVERYWIICDPFGRGVAHNHQQSGGKFVLAIIVFSTIYNVNKFFEVSVGYATVEEEVYDDDAGEYRAQNVTRAIVAITSLRESPDYLKSLVIANFMVMVVLPLAILSVCHVLTYRKVRENTKRHNAISSHQKRDDAMAMLFFTIILFFVVCHSGKFVLNFYEISQVFYDPEDKTWPLWAFLLTRVNHFLLVMRGEIITEINTVSANGEQDQRVLNKCCDFRFIREKKAKQLFPEQTLSSGKKKVLQIEAYHLAQTKICPLQKRKLQSCRKLVRNSKNGMPTFTEITFFSPQQVVNSSVNFFIYCFRDAKFRNALVSLLRLKRILPLLWWIPRGSSPSSTSPRNTRLTTTAQVTSN